MKIRSSLHQQLNTLKENISTVGYILKVVTDPSPVWRLTMPLSALLSSNREFIESIVEGSIEKCGNTRDTLHKNSVY